MNKVTKAMMVSFVMMSVVTLPAFASNNNGNNNGPQTTINNGDTNYDNSSTVNTDINNIDVNHNHVNVNPVIKPVTNVDTNVNSTFSPENNVDISVKPIIAPVNVVAPEINVNPHNDVNIKPVISPTIDTDISNRQGQDQGQHQGQHQGIVGSGNSSSGSSSNSGVHGSGNSSSESNVTDSGNSNQGQSQTSETSSNVGNSGNSSQNQSSTASNQGNAQNISINNPKQFRNTPSVPVFTPMPSAPCRITGGMSMAFTGIGVGGSASIEDVDCNIRETSRNMAAIGYAEAALEIACQSKYAQAANLCGEIREEKAQATISKANARLSPKAEEATLDTMITSPSEVTVDSKLLVIREGNVIKDITNGKIYGYVRGTTYTSVNSAPFTHRSAINQLVVQQQFQQ